MHQTYDDLAKYKDEFISSNLVPGSKVRVFYNDNNPNNELRHILAIVDGDQIVYKVWSYRKNRWTYFVEWWYAFYLGFSGDRMELK